MYLPYRRRPRVWIEHLPHVWQKNPTLGSFCLCCGGEYGVVDSDPCPGDRHAILPDRDKLDTNALQEMAFRFNVPTGTLDPEVPGEIEEYLRRLWWAISWAIRIEGVPRCPHCNGALLPDLVRCWWCRWPIAPVSNHPVVRVVNDVQREWGNRRGLRDAGWRCAIIIQRNGDKEQVTNLIIRASTAVTADALEEMARELLVDPVPIDPKPLQAGRGANDNTLINLAWEGMGVRPDAPPEVCSLGSSPLERRSICRKCPCYGSQHSDHSDPLGIVDPKSRDLREGGILRSKGSLDPRSPGSELPQRVRHLPTDSWNTSRWMRLKLPTYVRTRVRAVLNRLAASQPSDEV